MNMVFAGSAHCAHNKRVEADAVKRRAVSCCLGGRAAQAIVRALKVPTLQEQQAPIDAEIVNAMIASTPETWKAIRLVFERKSGTKAIGQFVHELSSPEGYPPIGPDSSLFEATFKLDRLLQVHGGLLRRAEYLAQQKGEQWSYKSHFEYENGAL